MYYLFREKNIMPMDSYNMGPGEKRVIHGFIIQEQEDLEKMRGDD